MRRGQVADTTAETVAGDWLGDAVLTSVVSRIEDKRERALFFAHVALDLPLPTLARAFSLDRKAVEKTIAAVLQGLRSDEDLAGQLSGIRRAGRPEHYLIIAEKLNLEDWLCARCGRFIVQPKTGRPRKTCSDTCRVALSLAGGRGWRDAVNRDSRAPHGFARPENGDEMRRRSPLALTAQQADAMRNLACTIVGKEARIRWEASRDRKARDAALLLLGFSCPVQLSPTDLADLSLKDVVFTPKGLEIRLHWSKDKASARQYVTIPPDRDSQLCVVQAMRTWRRRLHQVGCQTGPLFRQMGRWEQVKSSQPGMGGRAVASIIRNAMAETGLFRLPRSLPQSALLPTFLKEVAEVAVRKHLDH